MPETTRRNILVIEDDASTSKLLTSILVRAGYEVHSVRCGTTGIECVADTEPSLVILDIGLPDMNGFEVCKQLRRTSNPWSMPILVLTGLDRPADQLRGFALGADAYLTKPCHPPELLRIISLLISGGYPDPVDVN